MEWVDKHKPEKWDEVLGSEQNLMIMQNFFWAWSEKAPFAHAILLAGEEGCGKTTVARVGAFENNFELVSINASEEKDMKTYQDLRLTSGFESWSNESKCVLIDECDGLGRRFDSRASSRSTKGSAWYEIEKMINSGKSPVVMCCNYSENIPWRIRSNKNVTVLDMTSRSIPKQALFNRLMNIAKREGYQANVNGVKRIVKICPTVRSCIKTLQLCCVNDNWKAIYPRDVDGSIETRFLNLFRGKAKVLPTKETYRLMNYALVNGVPLKQIEQFNRLSLIRRSIAGFNLHEKFAFCLQNKELENLVKPKFFERKSNKKQEENRKKTEEKKRKALMKKLEDKPKTKSKPKKEKKKSAVEPVQDGWGDLF